MSMRRRAVFDVQGQMIIEYWYDRCKPEKWKAEENESTD